MKINRDHFLAAAFVIGAMNAAACKAKIGEDATPEGTNQAEGVGAPATETGLAPGNQAQAPKLVPPLKSPTNEGAVNAPAAETAPAGGWGAPPPATAAPVATAAPWGGHPTPTAAPVATTKPTTGWTQPKPTAPPPPPPAPAKTAGWTQPKK